MECKRETDGRRLDHRTLEVMRLQAVRAARAGIAVETIAKTLGLNKRTVFRWLAEYAKGGQKALRAKPIPGRPPKLSAQELRWIARTVREETPLEHQFPCGLWTLSIIRELIRRELGKELSIPSVLRVMKLLGFSAQRPLYQAWQQDARRVRQWERQTYPQIRAEAKAREATIYFADESGIRSEYHTGTTWAPAGETPVLNATGQHFALNRLSAVSPRGELRFMLHEGSVTASVFREFLKRLMIGATRPVVVIVDGHPIHRAKLIKDFVERLKGRLTLYFLPPYSPELNPDAAVWGHVKRNIARGMVQDQNHLKRLALGALRRLQKLPNLVRAFFQQPECQYSTRW